AAALGHCSPRNLFAWSLSPSAAADAVAILSSQPHAAPGWAESLESTIHADPRTRDSIWMGVSLALTCLADPRVMDAVSPGPGESFDPATFLRDNGTMYLLSTGAGASSSWSLGCAVLEPLVEPARAVAADSPGARLDPPLLLALDEIGNLSPLPSLPVLMAEGGGTGITTMPVLQSLSQARARWATTTPAPSGTPPSSRSSSAARPSPKTSKTFPPSSANTTGTPTPSPSATTATAQSNGPCAESPSCPPRPSACSRSAPP